MKSLRSRITRGIPRRSQVDSCDNSGAKKLVIVSVKGGGGKTTKGRNAAAGVGDLVFASVIKGTQEMRKQVVPCVIVRQRKEYRRSAIAKFVAKDKFVINTKRNASVKISSLGDNFTGWFLSGDSKIEDPISAQTFCCHKLRKSSANGPIIKELGGEAKAEAILSEMFSLLEKQGHREEGILLTNGWANIFYIRDLAGVLRVVFVRWCDGDWFVSAYAVESPRVWGGGGRVFSRNSALKSFVTAVV